jgi:hypothetical protein
MKRTILTFGTIIAFTAGSTLFTSCGSNTSSEDETTEQHDEDSDHSETMAEATHVCPMHPEITGLEGDTCSKCGMDLVVSADEAGEMEHKDMATTHDCPMHPEITGLEGDTCSKCGMDLTLAETSEEEGGQH